MQTQKYHAGKGMGFVLSPYPIGFWGLKSPLQTESLYSNSQCQHKNPTPTREWDLSKIEKKKGLTLF
jgi:hypothetical protein